MNYLPIFADLSAKPVLVVGGGDIAARKITLLRRAHAQVRVVACDLCPQLLAWVNGGEISWVASAFEESQLDDVFLVIAATSDHALNTRVYEIATRHHLLVNVVDDQPNCSFIFPSIVDRSPVVIAISSAGTAPVLARLLREKLEALLPTNLGQMAQIAGRWRDRVKQRIRGITGRRHFWENLFNGLFASQVAAGDLHAAEHTLAQQLVSPAVSQGEIILVGAGPGEPGLLTLRGLQVLQAADVVLYDHLVSDEILALARRDARRVCVGKRAGAHSVCQEETNRQLVSLAREGLRVVRLKGGDPFIFGRGGEELQVAQQAGIPFQVVPGLTAASGAAAYAGIPLTHRDYAQSVLFITGHCQAGVTGINWPALVHTRQTLAIYMGTMKAAEISQQLIAHGRAIETPVAVIGRGTRLDQVVLTGTLQQLDILAKNAPSPALLVIGEVVNLHAQLAWFHSAPRQRGYGAAVVHLA